MDPFLETPHLWKSVHTRLIVAASDAMADLLPPEFFVDIEQRVYITRPGDADRLSIEPDAFVIRESAPQYLPTFQSGGISPAVAVSPPEPDAKIEDKFLVIRDTNSREVITTVELLSPFNKRPGAQGFAAFQRKRQAVMASATHWIEIDLLRVGHRPPEVEGLGDYYALLKRGELQQPYAAWPFNLPDPMPTIAVPLRPPHPDIPLDLQAILHDVYVRARYARSIDYSQPVPPPPLRPEDQAWAQARIEAWRAQNETTRDRK